MKGKRYELGLFDMSNKSKGFVGGLSRMAKRPGSYPFSFRAFCVLLFSDKNQIKMEPGVLKPLILIYVEKKWNLWNPVAKFDK